MPVLLFVSSFCALVEKTAADRSFQDANDIFSQAGYSSYKARWLAGTNDIFYMVRQIPSIAITSKFGINLPTSFQP